MWAKLVIMLEKIVGEKRMTKSEIVINQEYEGFNPVQFGSETCEPGHSFGPCVRTHWLLHYVVYGFGIFVRDNTTWRVGPGEIFVIPPYEETYYEADMEKPWRYIWVGFTMEGDELSVLEEPVIRCAGAGAVFEDMLRCSKLNNGRSAFLSGKIWELMSVLLEQGEEDSDYVKKALSYMNSEYVHGITVQQIAEKVNLDRSYFSSMFKEQMGVSPQKYLMNLRLMKAAELMTTYRETPSTAGASVGYPDLYHFSKVFKQHFGVSPRSYQKQYFEKKKNKWSDG